MRVIILAMALLFSVPVANAADCSVHYSVKWGRTIQRCHSTVVAFKKEHPCPSTGKTYGRCPGYVVDHIKALKRGGADATYNMQWQTIEDARAKDKWE